MKATKKPKKTIRGTKGDGPCKMDGASVSPCIGLKAVAAYNGKSGITSAMFMQGRSVFIRYSAITRETKEHIALNFCPFCGERINDATLKGA